MTDELILIRTYEFEGGILHLEQGACSDSEAADLHADKGRLLKAYDSQMLASQFFKLPDFNDL